jgi:hypothetical protein
MTTEEIFVESKVQEELQKDIFDMPSQTQDSTESFNQPILDRDLIEGRDRGEGEVASWFYNSNWPLLLARIPNKGLLSVMFGRFSFRSCLNESNVLVIFTRIYLFFC